MKNQQLLRNKRKQISEPDKLNLKTLLNPKQIKDLREPKKNIKESLKQLLNPRHSQINKKNNFTHMLSSASKNGSPQEKMLSLYSWNSKDTKKELYDNFRILKNYYK